jgi:hypothetical protein
LSAKKSTDSDRERHRTHDFVNSSAGRFNLRWLIACYGALKMKSVNRNGKWLATPSKAAVKLKVIHEKIVDHSIQFLNTVEALKVSKHTKETTNLVQREIPLECVSARLPEVKINEIVPLFKIKQRLPIILTSPE